MRDIEARGSVAIQNVKYYMGTRYQQEYQEVFKPEWRSKWKMW